MDGAPIKPSMQALKSEAASSALYLNCGIVGTVMRGGGSGAILDAFPIPLGSTITLFMPPAFAGPGAIPLIGTFPDPAPPALRANEAAGAARITKNAKATFTGMFDMAKLHSDFAGNVEYTELI
jgi:hypothetical protein